jgi:hypothetical protein
VPTFVDRGVSRGQRGGSLTVVNLSFLYIKYNIKLVNEEWFLITQNFTIKRFVLRFEVFTAVTMKN